MIVHEIEPYNAEPPRGALASAALTSVDSFYVRSHGPIPDTDPARWRLRVNGLVTRELELTLAELHDHFPVRREVATLQCAGNRRSGLIAVHAIPGEAPWGPG
ncbi:MAG: molybdopterin-dependent oxidoreductase, partial [Solirubrobacteraceae bacterium]